MQVGVVYGIFFATADRAWRAVYVGSTDDYWKRWDRHLRAMRRGNHSNPWVQAAFVKVGERRTVFRRLLWLDGVEPDQLIVYEAATIERYCVMMGQDPQPARFVLNSVVRSPAYVVPGLVPAADVGSAHPTAVRPRAVRLDPSAAFAPGVTHGN